MSTKSKVYFIHFHNKYKEFGWNYAGFTARIETIPESLDVLVNVSVCSKKDRFSRRVGREQAEKNRQLRLSSFDVPWLLANYHARAIGYRHDVKTHCGFYSIKIFSIIRTMLKHD